METDAGASLFGSILLWGRGSATAQRLSDSDSTIKVKYNISKKLATELAYKMTFLCNALWGKSYLVCVSHAFSAVHPSD